VDPSYNTLLHVHHQRLVRAEHGRHGQGSNKTGAGGADVVIGVPPGTVVRDADDLVLVGDLVEAEQELAVARGGRGGRGNARFKTSTDRAPRHAEEGQSGEDRELVLELKLLADVGLVGLPNAGKSTLLSRVSAARPKIADYPFTTLEPQLGVVQAPGDAFRTVVMADIPGLIEGAHRGAGLGTQFLRHIERCRLLALLVDLTGPDPVAEPVAAVRAELESHSTPLHQRPWVLVGTKVDATGVERDRAVRELQAVASEYGVAWVAISAVTGEGLTTLVGLLVDRVGSPEVRA
jgi:GTP-binding protein